MRRISAYAEIPSYEPHFYMCRNFLSYALYVRVCPSSFISAYLHMLKCVIRAEFPRVLKLCYIHCIFPCVEFFVPDAALPWVPNIRHACPIFVYAKFLLYSPCHRMIWILSHTPHFHASRNFVIRIPNNLHIVFRHDPRDLLCDVMLPLFRYTCK